MLARSLSPYCFAIAAGLAHVTNACSISNLSGWAQIVQVRRWRPRLTGFSFLSLCIVTVSQRFARCYSVVARAGWLYLVSSCASVDAEVGWSVSTVPRSEWGGCLNHYVGQG